MVAIEVDQPYADAVQDRAHVRIPLREHVVSVLHLTAVFDLRTRLASETLRFFQEYDPPAPQRQFPGDDHAGEAPTYDDCRTVRHSDYSTTSGRATVNRQLRRSIAFSRSL